MIKFVVAALWLCAVTVGTIFFSFNSASHTPVEEGSAPGYFGGLDYIKADMISVPYIKDAAVDGYFLTRLVYTAEPDKMKMLKVPIQNLLLDAVYGHIYGNFPIDVSKPDSFNVEALKVGIRDSINERAGDTLIHEVLVEQVDYIPKSEIRDNAIRRRIAPTKFLTTGAEGEAGTDGHAAPKEDGH